MTWQSNLQDGSEYGIFARRFNASGVAQGGELMINTYTSQQQNLPAVGIDDSGEFVIAWGSEKGPDTEVLARRFNAAGVPQGDEFQVNSATPDWQQYAAIDLDADGDFVVVWITAFDVGLRSQRFNSTGVRQAFEFQVHTDTTSERYYPSVGLDADGDFVVVWHANDDLGDFDIWARHFSSAGAPFDQQVRVVLNTADDQFSADVALDASGDFVVSWAGEQTSTGDDVFARRFKSVGTSEVSDLHVNTDNLFNQFSPRVAADADGDFVVVWTTEDGYAGYEIRAQRFNVPILFDVDGDGQFTALTDGLLILRFGFGFTGATLTTGAVGPGCSRCDASTILEYLRSFL